MKTRISLIVFIVLATVWACMTPAASSEISISSIGPNRNASALLLATKTPTRRPTRTPTKRPTRTPTNTPLPPLPDFAEVLSFSPGAGGGACPGPDFPPNTIVASGGGPFVGACFWLTGLDLSKPFRIYLSQPGVSTGKRFASPDLLFDVSGHQIRWKGYADWSSVTTWEENAGVLTVYNFGVRLPAILSPGTWRFSIAQEASAFGVYGSDFKVSDNVAAYFPYVHVVTRPAMELTPFEPLGTRHIAVLNSRGRIGVTGEGFSRKAPVYLLIYRETSQFTGEMALVSKRVVISDRSGAIKAEIADPFRAGQIYLLVGLNGPNVELLDDSNALNWNDPGVVYDRFEIAAASSAPLTVSCPGAPPQRMIVNRRGYVCTQGDNVRVRSAPARSASTIVSLAVNSGFSVVGGPACADNWSWWQIQTDSGYSGWISEGGDAIDPYFICPSP